MGQRLSGAPKQRLGCRVKVRRILLDEYKERLRRGKCPRCLKSSLQMVEITQDQPLPKTKYKFLESFWVCGSHPDFSCYFMAGLASPILFESAEGVDIIDFTEDYVKPSGAKIIRRRGGECVEIKPPAAVNV